MAGHHKHHLYYDPYKSIGELKKYKFLNLSTSKLKELFEKLKLSREDRLNEIYNLITGKNHEDNKFEDNGSFEKIIENNFNKIEKKEFFQGSLILELYQSIDDLKEFRLIIYLDGKKERNSCLRLKERNAGDKITTIYGGIYDFIKRLEISYPKKSLNLPLYNH